MGLWSETATILPGHAAVPPTKEQHQQPPEGESEQRPQQLLRRPSNWVSQLLTSDWPLSTPPHHKKSIDTDPFDMPSLNGFAAAGPEQTNGNGAHAENGITHRPKTPTNSTMALTEYSVCPSPPSETAQARIKQIVPDEFLLPDGYPDVCILPNK